MGQAGLPGEECSVWRAGNKGPERATAVGKLLKDIPDEGSRLADDGWEGDGAVIIRVLFGADDGGEESDKGEDMGKAGRVVLHVPAEGGQVGQGGLPPVEEALQEAGQTDFLVWGDRDGAPEGVDHHAGVVHRHVHRVYVTR